MATRQYIGARYVPKFADPIAWDKANSYEALTIVTYLNNSYTSKKAVPTNTEITNTEYWVVTGNYNAQVQEYIQEVEDLKKEVEENKIFITPQMFGAKGDGVNNDADALQNALIYLHEKNGGTLCIPEGKYFVSKTVYVPSNVSVIGCGYKSLIYLTNPQSEMGVAVCVVGSNITISNLNVGFIGDNTPPVTGTQLGALGVSNYRFENVINNDLTVAENIENILIEKIYSDSKYALQTENVNNYLIKNLVYNNIFTPNSMISISPATPHAIENAIISNVNCSALRIGYGANGCDSCLIENVHCHYLRIIDNNVSINNVIVDCTDKTDNHYLANLYEAGVYLDGNNVKLSNVTVIGNHLNNYRYGIHYERNSIDFINVKSTNFIEKNLYSASGTPCNYINCDFLDEDVNKIASLYGYALNTKGKQLPIAEYYNFSEATPQAITDGTNWGDAPSIQSRIERIGNKGYLKLLKSCSSTLTDNLIIGTVSDRMKPTTKQFMIATLLSNQGTATIQIPVTIDVDGTLTIENVFSYDLTPYNKLLIDSEYTLY